MAGKAEKRRDPADIAATRSEKVKGLIASAEELEQRAKALGVPTKLEDVAVMNMHFTTATNFRVRALCIHHRLPTTEDDEYR